MEMLVQSYIIVWKYAGGNVWCEQKLLKGTLINMSLNNNNNNKLKIGD